MLNAVQARMVEESLVEKEVYEAMQTMRSRIEEHTLRVPGVEHATGTSRTTGSRPRQQPRKRAPDLDDLPVGTPPAWHPASKRQARVPTVTPSRRYGAAAEQSPVPPSESPSAVPLDAMVPATVLAAGDPARDPNRKVSGYIPETLPSDNAGDPFPQLGPQGRPLG